MRMGNLLKFSKAGYGFGSLVVCLMLSPTAWAQSNAEWIQIKAKCGLPSSLAYNDWVAQGAPCNQASSSSSTASSTGNTLPSLPTSQQQAAMQIGQLGVNMMGEGLRQLLYGKPEDPAVQQQRLAAEQLNNSGVWYLRQKKYGDAIIEFQKALEKTPGNPAIQRNLSLAKQMQERSNRDSAAASRTSSSLGQLLGPPGLDATATVANDPATALRSLNLASDPNVVDLRGTTKTAVDPAALKNGVAAGSDNVQSQDDFNAAFDKALTESEQQSQSERDQLNAEFDKLYNQAAVGSVSTSKASGTTQTAAAPTQASAKPKDAAQQAPPKN